MVAYIICDFRLTQGDGGVDLIAVYHGTTYIIQCKDHEQKISVKYIREFESVIGRLGKTVVGIMVLPEDNFTSHAKRWARTSKYSIFLTDKMKICSIIKHVTHKLHKRSFESSHVIIILLSIIIFLLIVLIIVTLIK